MGKDLQQWEQRIGRRVRLRDLHILSVVVACGSMGKAARQLAMSQPSVSESVSNLEFAMGVPLLDRSPRGVEPTLYGSALLRRGDAVFDELMQGVREIEFLSDPQQGEVRVATGDTGAAGLLAPAIDRLATRYPQIVVRVSQSSAEPLGYPELRERRVDVVLARISRTFAHDELDIDWLFDDPPRVAAGLRSPWARRRKVDIAELVHERWALTSDQVIHEFVLEAFRARGLPPPREQVTASSMLLRSRLLDTGRYLTVLPASVLAHNARAWGIKTLPVQLDMQPMCLTLLTLRRRTLSPVAALLIEQVRSLCRL